MDTFQDDLDIPAGFAHLLKDFTREVLRDQPSNIAAYGADFFANQLARQEAQGVLLYTGSADDGASVGDNAYDDAGYDSQDEQDAELEREMQEVRARMNHDGYAQLGEQVANMPYSEKNQIISEMRQHRE